MPDEPPSILPRGTGTRRRLSPSPALPGSAVYIQSVAGLSCIAAGAIGSAEISGGRSPASISATRHDGSSERRDAMTAPAEPPPTTMKSNSSDISASPFVWGRFRPVGLLEAVGVVDHEEPSAVRLPARDLGALSFHPHGLTVGANAFEHPLRRREGEVAALGELLRIELDPGLHGEKAAQRLADGPGAGGHLPGLRHETGPGFVELEHGLDVARVDRLGE